MKSLLYVFSIVMVMASCNMGMNTNNNAVQIAKNKAAMQSFFNDVVNKHNAAFIDSLCSADFVDHSPDSGYTPNCDGLKKDFADLFKAFPDLTATINVLTADSNFVTAEATWTGTNTGTMDSTKPASGKKFNIEGIDLFTFKNGKATQHWGYYDEMKLMRQMGWLPGNSAMAMSDTSKAKQ